MYNVLSYFGHINEQKSLNDSLLLLINSTPADYPEDVRELLEKGADPNYETYSGVSLLHFAAMAGKPKTLETLIEFGARLDTAPKVDPSLTPLNMACIYSSTHLHKICAKILINAGCNIFTAFNNLEELSLFFGGDLSWVTGKNAEIINRAKKVKKIFNK